MIIILLIILIVCMNGLLLIYFVSVNKLYMYLILILCVLIIDSNLLSFGIIIVLPCLVYSTGFIKSVKRGIKLFLIRIAIGKEGMRYKESKYLKFDKHGDFYYEIRDKRFRNTFLIDKHGVIKNIYYPLGEDTMHRIDDIIDIADMNNVYIPVQTRGEMNKYSITRSYISENRL